jgi:hypothetical protein
MKKLSLIFLLLIQGFLGAQNPTPLEKLKENLSGLTQQFDLLKNFIAALPKVESVIEPVEKSEEEKRREEAQKRKEEEETKKAEAEKRARELNELGYLTVMGTYNQMISKLSEKPNAQELHDWLENFKRTIQSSLPDTTVVKLLEQTGNQFFDLYEKKYQDFKDESPKFFALLENIVIDMNNLFAKSEQDFFYKGNDIPKYEKQFTLQDYELFEKSLHEYKKLKERALAKEEGIKFFKTHENYLISYKKWIDLPPTITFDKKKYSPLETQIKNNLIQAVEEYRPVQAPNPKQKGVFKELFKDLTNIVYRNNDKETLRSLASIYQKILGTELTWSQNFKDFETTLKKDIKNAEERYNKQKSIYQAIPLKNRTREDYKAMKEAFQELVKFRAPSEKELQFYANIGKEEEKIEEKEEEEEERDEQLAEELKTELEKIKNITDFSQYSKEVIQEYIKKIQNYRKLSENNNAYQNAFTFLSQELKKK